MKRVFKQIQHDDMSVCVHTPLLDLVVSNLSLEPDFHHFGNRTLQLVSAPGVAASRVRGLDPGGHLHEDVETDVTPEGDSPSLFEWLTDETISRTRPFNLKTRMKKVTNPFQLKNEDKHETCVKLFSTAA